MYVQFDKNKLHAQIICGTKEEYKPTKEIAEIQDRLDRLQEKVAEFQKKTEEFKSSVIDPELKVIEKLVNEQNKVHYEEKPKEPEKK